jgi:hypothetical protein
MKSFTEYVIACPRKPGVNDTEWNISASDDINLVGEKINTIKEYSKISFVILMATG